MESVLAFIGLASVVLLLVALGVAWWEQRHGSVHKLSQPQPLPHFPLPVDVEIDTPAVPALPLNEQAARRAMLGDVLARVARPAGASAAAAWLETRPTVLDKLPPERLRHDGEPQSRKDGKP